MTRSSREALVRRILAGAWKAADALDWQTAISLADKAVHLMPNHADAWVARGRFLWENGDREVAEESIRKAISINPKSNLAWTELGLLLESDGLYRKAAFCFCKSVEICPDYNVYTLLAGAQLGFDLEAAKRNAENALGLKPGWPEAAGVRAAAEEGLRKRRR
jgi:tetratricopeptide (TPR) repeat protein